MSIDRPAFLKNGFFIAEDVIDSDELAAIREELLQQASFERKHGVAWLGDGGRGRRTFVGGDTAKYTWQCVRSLPNKGHKFILCAEAIADRLVAPMLGSGTFQLSSMSGLLTWPGARSMVVHTDQQYVYPAVTAMASITVIVAVDPFIPSGGATRVLSGSHIAPPPPRFFNPQLGDYVNTIAIKTNAIEMRAGSALVMDGRLWHSSGDHISSRPRLALALLFSKSFLKQQDNYPALLREDVTAMLTVTQRELLGFASNGFGRLDPKAPDCSWGVGERWPYIPKRG